MDEKLKKEIERFSKEDGVPKSVVVRDPDDNKVLECAFEARADLIITADKDLLALKEFNSIKIIHPSSLKYIFPQLKKPEK